MKTKLYSIFLFFVLCIITPIMTSSCGSSKASSTQYKQDYITHVVAKGETSYSISKKYSIDLNQLYKLNPLAIESIKEGQELIIPILLKTDYQTYKPRKGDTAYSISKQFGVTVDDIFDANPKLGQTGLKEGKEIRIPVFGAGSLKPSGAIHKVQAKETLYSIAKQYDVTIDEILSKNPDAKKGLNKDMLLAIPKSGSVQNVVLEKAPIKVVSESLAKVKMAILLPFLDKDGNKNDRYLEYYEGFLLAVEDLKAKGLSLDIYTFDIGAGGDNKKLESLLEGSDIASVHMIIGGVTNEQVAIISKYTQEKGIKYIIPFPSKSDAILTNKNIFQVSVAGSELNEKACRVFINKYKNDNIIFLSNKATDDKIDFTNLLKSELNKVSVNYTEVKMIDKNFNNLLKESFSSYKKNIIVPTSSSFQVLAKTLSVLTTITSSNSESSFDINLFGYPDWQAYTKLHPDMSRFGTSIYTSFYPKTAVTTSDFDAKFEQAYTLKMINTFPKFGIMGYDTGMYFIPSIQEYGVNFDKSLSKITYNSLQNAFHFVKKHKNGGYINDGLYMINFSDLGIERMDYSKE